MEAVQLKTHPDGGGEFRNEMVRRTLLRETQSRRQQCAISCQKRLTPMRVFFSYSFG